MNLSEEQVQLLRDVVAVLEQKERRVRTPEGARRFKQPIGAVIVDKPDIPTARIPKAKPSPKQTQKTPSIVEKRFASAKTGKSAYLNNYKAQESYWESQYDNGYGNTDYYDAIDAWTSGDYEIVNAALSNNEGMENTMPQSQMTVSQFIEKINATFDSSPEIEDDLIVRRHTRTYYPVVKALTQSDAGDTFVFDQYVATTMLSEREWSGPAVSAGDTVLEILVPGGSRALIVDAIRFSGVSEYEVLLDKGSSFTVVSKPVRRQGKWYIRLLMNE